MKVLLITILFVVVCSIGTSCRFFDQQSKLQQRLVEIIAKADAETARKNYDEAIRLYDSALAISPNEPVCLSRRAKAYRSRGTDRYNPAIKLEKAEEQVSIDSAKRDFLKAADDATAAVSIIKNSPYINFIDLLTREQHYLYAVAVRADCLDVVATIVDQNRADEALDALHEYINIDNDDARKTQTRLIAGKMLLNTGHGDRALEDYQTVLAGDPNNIEGLLGVGLALSQSGDAEKYKEAKKFLKRFVELAPDDHPMKADIVNTLKYSDGK